MSQEGGKRSDVEEPSFDEQVGELVLQFGGDRRANPNATESRLFRNFRCYFGERSESGAFVGGVEDGEAPPARRSAFPPRLVTYTAALLPALMGWMLLGCGSAQPPDVGSILFGLHRFSGLKAVRNRTM